MMCSRRQGWDFCVLLGFFNDLPNNKKNLESIKFCHEDFMFIVNEQQLNGMGNIHKTFSEIDCEVELIATENNVNSNNDIHLYRGKVLNKDRIEVRYAGDSNHLKMSCCGATVLVNNVPTDISYNYTIVLITTPTEKTTNLLRSMMAINVVGNVHVIVTSRKELTKQEDDF